MSESEYWSQEGLYRLEQESPEARLAGEHQSSLTTNAHLSSPTFNAHQSTDQMQPLPQPKIKVLGYMPLGYMPQLSMPAGWGNVISFEEGVKILDSHQGHNLVSTACKTDLSAAGTSQSSPNEITHMKVLDTHQESCAICLEDYRKPNHKNGQWDVEKIARMGSCEHYFHPECIQEWLQGESKCCPVCRSMAQRSD